MAFRLQSDVLRRTLSSAQATARKFAAHAPTTNHGSDASLPTKLSLPTPDPLTPRLIALGIHAVPAEIISSAFSRMVGRWTDTVQTEYNRRCHDVQDKLQYVNDAKFAASIIFAYTTIYAQGIRHWTSYIVDLFAPRVLDALAAQQQLQVTASQRKVFPLTSISILETFFEKNAFPSKLEKYELANKSGLDLKQIRNWFQNRRSRSKKGGRMLKKREQSTDLAEVENVIIDVLLLQNSEEDSDDLALNAEAPPHAYPAPYPPSCSYDPFPCEQPFQTPWMRSRAVDAIPSTPDASSNVDVSELTATLARLSVHDTEETGARPSGRLRRVVDSCSPLFRYAFATICPRAPHPALVRRPQRPLRAPCSSSRSSSKVVDEALRGCRRFQYPRIPGPISADGQSERRSISAGSPQPQQSKRRLPRRVPKHPPSPHDPALQSPARYGSVSSRTSSVSSQSTLSDNHTPPPSPPSTSTLYETRPFIVSPINDKLGFGRAEHVLDISSYLDMFPQQSLLECMDKAQQHILAC